MGAIDSYVAELDERLRGPKAVKADLLTELRDGLVDAAEAYRSAGEAPAVAERRAVEDFGDVEAVAPDCRTQLGLAQGRRTALLIFVVLTIQHVVLSLAWSSDAATSGPAPTPIYAFFSDLVDWIGLLVKVGALIALLACGIGARFISSQDAVVRATGVFAYVVHGFLGLSGLALTLGNLDVVRMLLESGLVWLTMLAALPLVLIARSGRQCLRAV